MPFEVYLRTMDTDYNQKLKGFEDSMSAIEVLVLGNSHAINGADPREFDYATYNMAGHNQSLYFDKRIALKHIDKLSSLKYVLIPADYHSFYFSSQGIRDTWSYYAYNIKYKDNKEILADVSYFWFGYTPKISMSIIKFNLLEYMNRPSGNDELIKGYMPNYGTDLGSFQENSVAYQGKWFNDVVQPSNERDSILADLDDFITQLKKRNIKPILYTMPLYKEVYPYLDTSYMVKNQKDIKVIVKKHHIPYVDLTKNSTLTKDFFYDVNHLNSKGAKIVSKKLNDFIVRLEYIEKK